MGRTSAVVALLATLAAAAEPDGAIAEPARWTGPHGPAGHTRRSRAIPVVRDVVEAWAVELPGTAATPPVTWDGIAYLSCVGKRGETLCAIDLASGRLVAKKILPKSTAKALHVWAGVVYLQTTPNQVSGFRLVGKTFVERWKYGGKKLRPEGMVAIENEIYVVSRGSLLRLAPGHAKPIWKSFERFAGPPAVYGNSVLAVGESRRATRLYALRRRDGIVTASPIIGYGGDAGDRAMTIGTETILVPFGYRGGFMFVPYEMNGDEASPTTPDGSMKFQVQPAVYKQGLIACEGKNEWQWWVGKKGRVLARRRWTPDLFEGPVPPTVLGDVVYFGTWAADVETGEILWRLPLRTVSFGAVPADRLVVVTDGTHLRAYRSRVGR